MRVGRRRISIATRHAPNRASAYDAWYETGLGAAAHRIEPTVVLTELLPEALAHARLPLVLAATTAAVLVATALQLLLA